MLWTKKSPLRESKIERKYERNRGKKGKKKKENTCEFVLSSFFFD
jgi:hypothetical protein